MQISRFRTESRYTLRNFGSQHYENLVLLGVLALLIIFVGIGLRGPWPADEPRFALVAKEMVDSGQWLFPSRGGEYYPDKPPVFMWSIAIFYWLIGSINVAFLLPSALCGLMTLFAVYDITRRLWDNQTGMVAGLALLASLQFVLQAKTAQIDGMVCCWITLGCYCLLRFLLLDKRWKWYLAAFFFMGLGVITKGVGFLPLLMLLPYAVLRFTGSENTSEINGGWKWLLGPVVLLATIGMWLIPMLIVVEHSGNPALEVYRDNILFRQTVTRYADSWHHIKPFWYYIVAVVPVFWLPLAALIPWFFKPWKQAILDADRRVILPLFWIILVLVFFSLSPGKRGVYILPALPMLAMISAPYIKTVIARSGPQWLLWGITFVVASLLLVLGVSGLYQAKFAVKLIRAYPIEPWWLFITLGGFGVLSSALSFRKWRAFNWLIFIPFFWLVYSTWGYTLLSSIRTPERIYEQAKTILEPNAQVALVDFSEQFLLYSPYQMTHFGYHTDHEVELKSAWVWLSLGSSRYVILPQRVITDCFDEGLAKELGVAHRRTWMLLNSASRLNTCLPETNSIDGFSASSQKESTTTG